jgi:hypothetical protein
LILKIIDSLIQGFMNLFVSNHFRFFLVFLIKHIKFQWTESHNLFICNISILL